MIFELESTPEERKSFLTSLRARSGDVRVWILSLDGATTDVVFAVAERQPPHGVYPYDPRCTLRSASNMVSACSLATLFDAAARVERGVMVTIKIKIGKFVGLAIERPELLSAIEPVELRKEIIAKFPGDDPYSTVHVGARKRHVVATGPCSGTLTMNRTLNEKLGGNQTT